MQENLKETEITCPSCGFKMSRGIDKIPKDCACPNCKTEFSIVVQVSAKNKMQ